MSNSTAFPAPNRKLKIYFQAIDGCIGHLNACQGLAEVLAERGHEVAFMVTGPTKAAAIKKLGFKTILLADKDPVDVGHGSGSSGHGHGHQETKGHGHDHGHSKDQSGHSHDHGHQEGKCQHGHDPSKAKDQHSHDHGHQEVKGHAHPVSEQANANLARGLFSPKSPLEQLQAQMDHFSTNAHLTGNFQTTIEMTPKLEAILKGPQTAPDVIVIDSFIISPAILQSGIPWIYLFSANPMGLYTSPKMPPFGAGFSIASDPSSWTEYKALQMALSEKAYTTFQSKLNETFKLEPSLNPYTKGRFFPHSPYLNIFGYPEELSYNDVVPMPEKTISVDAFSRTTTSEEFSLPEGFLNPGEKLVFFSLGSQASANLELMRRILGVLGKHHCKYIVSKGPNGDQLELPANCYGANYLPQPAILPLVDAVITHGGK